MWLPSLRNVGWQGTRDQSRAPTIMEESSLDGSSKSYSQNFRSRIGQPQVPIQEAMEYESECIRVSVMY